MRKGLMIAKDAISNTGVGEGTFYLVLIAAGVMLIVSGLLIDAHGMAAAHPYAINLLDAATGFCFGIPVAGVVIREFTRRTRRRLRLTLSSFSWTTLIASLRSFRRGPQRS